MSIGQTLQQTRKNKELSLEDVQAKTKIQIRLLEYLESDQFDKMPGVVFTKNFLRTYADFLELDSRQIIDEYSKLGMRPKINDAPLFERKAKEYVGAPTKNKIHFLWPAIIAVIVLMGIIWAAPKVYSWLTRFSHKKLTQSSYKPTIDNSRKISSAVSAKQKSTQGAQYSLEPSKPSGNWLRSASQSNFPNLTPSVPLALSIKAMDNVWVHITADGKVVSQEVIKRGQTRNWTALKRIDVWSGNPASMDMALNGYRLGTPGKGSAKKMAITHDGVEKTG